jgi:hypothetical protein
MDKMPVAASSLLSTGSKPPARELDASLAFGIGQRLTVARVIEQMALKDLIAPDRLKRKTRPKVVLLADSPPMRFLIEVAYRTQFSDILDPQWNVVEITRHTGHAYGRIRPEDVECSHSRRPVVQIKRDKPDGTGPKWVPSLGYERGNRLAHVA